MARIRNATGQACVRVAVAAMVLFAVAACGHPSGGVATSTPAATATSAAPAETPASPTATSPAPTAPVRTVHGGKLPANGAELTTVIDTVTCVGEPISGFWTESDQNVSDRSQPPYGDIEIDKGAPNTDQTLQITHNILARDNAYRPNIGCGYVPGGDNDWLHEFDLPVLKGGEAHTIVCQSGVGCTVNGTKVTLRGSN
jgi:hypothetical protein